ncbi:MAG: FRG domain-containing protein [Chitinophagaceae bacterium]
MPFIDLAEPFIGKELIITSASEADKIHQKLIDFRVDLFKKGIGEFMPHYRGEQKLGWDIRPGIFRPPFHGLDSAKGKLLEQQGIKEFEKTIHDKIGKEALRSLFNNEKYGKNWDLLFQAQHAGVKTTLTDWTAFIISALYFVVEESKDPVIENSDGQLWCYMTPDEQIASHDSFFPEGSIYNINPFDLKNGVLINPSSYLHEIDKRVFESRMYKQKGRFIISSNDLCGIPLNNQEEFAQYLLKFRIPSENKKSIRDELVERGITRDYMYVDESPVNQDLITEINTRVFAI